MLRAARHCVSLQACSLDDLSAVRNARTESMHVIGLYRWQGGRKRMNSSSCVADVALKQQQQQQCTRQQAGGQFPFLTLHVISCSLNMPRASCRLPRIARKLHHELLPAFEQVSYDSKGNVHCRHVPPTFVICMQLTF